MTRSLDVYDRVYLPGDEVAHLTHAGLAGWPLCDSSWTGSAAPWPDWDEIWRGTGAQAEYGTAASLPLCAGCTGVATASWEAEAQGGGSPRRATGMLGGLLYPEDRAGRDSTPGCRAAPAPDPGRSLPSPQVTGHAWGEGLLDRAADVGGCVSRTPAGEGPAGEAAALLPRGGAAAASSCAAGDERSHMPTSTRPTGRRAQPPVPAGFQRPEQAPLSLLSLSGSEKPAAPCEVPGDVTISSGQDGIAGDLHGGLKAPAGCVRSGESARPAGSTGPGSEAR